ncbi:unnamed protein product [Rotaria socialis]|uniref:Uncharacterized protein n=1 Tax=Rotaria socialis TaxID=392032 RepID=A0A820Z373_9BILA|nr:unnamed protein product [Rotaria socialis]
MSYQISVAIAILCLFITILAVNIVESASGNDDTTVGDGNEGNISGLILIASVAKIKTFEIGLDDTTVAAETDIRDTSLTSRDIANPSQSTVETPTTSTKDSSATRNTTNPSQSTMETPTTSTKDSSATKNSLHSLFILVMTIKIII